LCKGKGFIPKELNSIIKWTVDVESNGDNSLIILKAHDDYNVYVDCYSITRLPKQTFIEGPALFSSNEAKIGVNYKGDVLPIIYNKALTIKGNEVVLLDGSGSSSLIHPSEIFLTKCKLSSTITRVIECSKVKKMETVINRNIISQGEAEMINEIEVEESNEITVSGSEKTQHAFGLSFSGEVDFTVKLIAKANIKTSAEYKYQSEHIGGYSNKNIKRVKRKSTEKLSCKKDERMSIITENRGWILSECKINGIITDQVINNKIVDSFTSCEKLKKNRKIIELKPKE